MQIPVIQHRVLQHLSQSESPIEVQTLAAALKCDQAQIAAACTTLAEGGLVKIDEREFDEFRPGKDAEPFATSPLPERIIVDVLIAQGGTCGIKQVPDHCDLNAGQVGQSLRWLAQRGWAKKEGDQLVLQDGAEAARGKDEPDELMIKALAGGRVALTQDLVAEKIAVGAAIRILDKRRGFLIKKTRTSRMTTITGAGRELLAAGVSSRESVTQLTPEMLADGSWRNVDLRPYDVTLAAKTRHPGKEHAFQRTMDKVRRVFLEMGFEEIVSPWVESGFWDFDALFQPQDHPARDMQDTFYIAKPDRTRLPDDELVERVKATHENGGDTGSTGWQYRWDRETACKPLLRTHTTAATIRALSKHAAGKPGKYFSIGPVFRRETVDYKHLPIFHQVDGIIVDPKASLATLKGTLAAFYQKMGFSKVEFAPSFFPYTEPSAEVLIYLEKKKDWVEMGGSGIFRPEVTRPLGITDRVLAWGLGLERLAMMIHDLKSIGEIYFASMPWLREAPLCRA